MAVKFILSHTLFGKSLSAIRCGHPGQNKPNALEKVETSQKPTLYRPKRRKCRKWTDVIEPSEPAEPLYLFFGGFIFYHTEMRLPFLCSACRVLMLEANTNFRNRTQRPHTVLSVLTWSCANRELKEPQRRRREQRRFQGPKIFNSINDEIINSLSLREFTSKLKSTFLV